MTDPVLAAVTAAITARQAAERDAERVEIQAVADAINSGVTWRQLADHLGDANAHRTYAKRLTKVGRVYRVRDAD